MVMFAPLIERSPMDVLVGARLAKLRIANGLSVAALGRLVDLDQFEVRQVEEGHRRLNARQMFAVCEFFLVRPRYFFQPA